MLNRRRRYAGAKLVEVLPLLRLLPIAYNHALVDVNSLDKGLQMNETIGQLKIGIGDSAGGVDG